MRRPRSQKARPRRGPARGATLLLLLTLPAAAAPAHAQRFGQWWWDGSVGFGQRSYDNEVDGSETSGYEQQELELSLGLHGYILHPAIARFDLRTDLAFAEIESGRDLDSDRLGLSGALELTPRGTYPTRLYFQRQRYDYGNLADEDPFTLAATPDVSTTWGFRNRIRRGPARGLLTGLESSDLEFLDPGLDTERNDRQFVQWDRRFGDFQHHVRLERRLRSYGAVDLEIEDMTLTIDERAWLGEHWRWKMSALGIQREIRVPRATMGLGVDDYRVRNQLTRSVRETDRLDLQYQVAAVLPERSDDTLGHDLRVFYRWRPRPAVEVAPFVQYFQRKLDGRTVVSPRVGLSTTWRGSLGALDVLATAQASAGQTTTDLPDGVSVDEIDEDQTSFGASLTLTHGNTRRLRKKLELDATRDDFRVDRSPVVDVPELGLPLPGATTQDMDRARFTLEHRRRGLSITGWTQWQRRDFRGDLTGRDFESEDLSATLQLGGQSWSLLGNVGELMTRRADVGDQTVDFVGGSLSWQPFRGLELYGSYRTDTRELLLAPDVDGERWQAGGRFHLGRLSFEGVIFETTESLMQGPERRNSGFRFSITRRFAGWLPIVTAPERRGVIR